MAENQERLSYAKYRHDILKQDGFLHRCKREFPSWWGTIADTISIVWLFVILVFNWHQNHEVLIALCLVTAIAIFALLAATVLYRRANRRGRYAYASMPMHTAIHILRDQLACGAPSNSDIKATLQEVLGAIAMAFLCCLSRNWRG